MTHSFPKRRSSDLREIASLIRKKEHENKPCVLGLATGNTPKLVYTELIRLHREENLSFRNVYTFNLDEYYPIAPDSPQSYVHFMKEQFIEHVDIPADHYFIPDVRLLMEEIPDFCKEYEQKRSDEHTSELQSLMRNSYAVFRLQKKQAHNNHH